MSPVCIYLVHYISPCARLILCLVDELLGYWNPAAEINNGKLRLHVLHGYFVEISWTPLVAATQVKETLPLYQWEILWIIILFTLRRTRMLQSLCEFNEYFYISYQPISLQIFSIFYCPSYFCRERNDSFGTIRYIVKLFRKSWKIFFLELSANFQRAIQFQP